MVSAGDKKVIYVAVDAFSMTTTALSAQVTVDVIMTDGETANSDKKVLLMYHALQSKLY